MLILGLRGGDDVGEQVPPLPVVRPGVAIGTAGECMPSAYATVFCRHSVSLCRSSVSPSTVPCTVVIAAVHFCTVVVLRNLGFRGGPPTLFTAQEDTSGSQLLP